MNRDLWGPKELSKIVHRCSKDKNKLLDSLSLQASILDYPSFM